MVREGVSLECTRLGYFHDGGVWGREGPRMAGAWVMIISDVVTIDHII